MIALQRKAWIIFAEAQLKRRRKVFGKEADVCDGCRDILICSGPVSFQMCRALDEMIATGLIKSNLKKIPWQRMRQRFLPIDEECLRKYGFIAEDGKLVKAA